MRRLWEKIDLHVTAMLLLMFLWAPCGGCAGQRLGWGEWSGWCLWGAMVLIPQGLILTRAFVDYPSFKMPKGMYLLANELQVAFFAGVSAGLWFLLEWLSPVKQ